MATLTILGAGGFGLSLAVTANRNGHTVTVWDRSSDNIADIRKHQEHRTKLPGVKIAEEIHLTSDLSCVADCELLLFAVPSQFVREVAVLVKPYVLPKTVLVNAGKGLEEHSFLMMSQVLEEILPGMAIVTLTGPSHAEEVGRGLPTIVVAASQQEQAAALVQDVFSSHALRLYINSDIIGCEIGGALKNIIALAAGVCDGLHCGDNAKAALMTRGIHEITNLGVVMGGRRETFGGLSGIGDLIVTCCSMHSRNRRAGILIGEGVSPAEAVRQVGTVEGYHCCHAAWHLAQKHHVSMPITEQLYGVLFEDTAATVAIQNLMSRPKRHEYEPYE